MNYSVEIRNNATGETVTYAMKNIAWQDWSTYWWTEGNFGCDCNRGQSFMRAKGYPEPVDHDCSNDKFTVIRATMEDGTELEIDGLSPEKMYRCSRAACDIIIPNNRDSNAQ